MNMEFDRKIKREGSGALKTDALKERFGKADLQSMWVADMDFATPEFIRRALIKRLEHPIYGYTVLPEDYKVSIVDWERSHHGWEINTEWITYIPGVVKGIGFVLNYFLRRGEKVIIQPPVYHPFRLVPEGNDIGVVMNPLKEVIEGGKLRGYEMDFEHLERVAGDGCRVLILSNPHNPAGICWSRQTLKRLAEICYRRGILVISDEIHADMALAGHKHIPFATVSEKASEISITFGAPSKVFNMPGIVTSWCVIGNKGLREPFYRWLEANELNDPPMLSPIATVAAYRDGENWCKDMLEYIEGNIDELEHQLASNVPQIKMLRPEASFLVWLDCRGLGMDGESLREFFVERAGLALNDGRMFGPGGEGFVRMNVGTPRSNIVEAVAKIRRALE
ncbi:MAG: PatB family C-S lyase [Prevotella sp.]|nr:PatB family C-S lyase [Bacteroides sp.]MCM1366929.1 PatB family C-S lyase [Prevotella sp.]MCM1437460.1 PatB family C-S lyase [Prevotella sp.]